MPTTRYTNNEHTYSGILLPDRLRSRRKCILEEFKTSEFLLSLSPPPPLSRWLQHKAQVVLIFAIQFVAPIFAKIASVHFCQTNRIS
jgi:hypothetical protein